MSRIASATATTRSSHLSRVDTASTSSSRVFEGLYATSSPTDQRGVIFVKYGNGVYVTRQALRELAGWLAQDLGRLYVGLFGGVVATVGLTLSSNRNTVANTAVVVGGVLVALGGLVPWFRRVQWKHGEVEMGIRSERVTEEDYREAVAEALDASPLRFELTEGHIVHIEKEERKARKRRIARQRRNVTQ